MGRVRVGALDHHGGGLQRPLRGRIGYPAAVPDGGISAYCAMLGLSPTGSPFPDNTQPGDVLTLTGKVESYLRASSCSAQPNASQVPQWRINNTCAVQKTGTATVPAPVVLTGADVTALNSPTDATAHGKWSGVRVRLEFVTAARPSTALDCITSGHNYADNWGTVTLTPSGLTVGSQIYYRGYLQAQVCKARPTFCGSNSSTFDFSVIQGLHHLDACAWSLLPNDKCADYTPPSDDCVVTSCAPY